MGLEIDVVDGRFACVTWACDCGDAIPDEMKVKKVVARFSSYP